MWAHFHVMVARIRALFDTSVLDTEFSRELESHLAMLEEEKVSRGLTPEAAQLAARREIGPPAQLRESHRHARGLPWIDTLLQDLRYTLRTLGRDAGFATFAILIAGIGIGACATIFSVVNTLLLRSLPFPESDRLVWMANLADDGVAEWHVQVDHLLDLRRQNTSFSDLAGYYAYYGIGDRTLTGDGEPERLTAVPVTQNFFSLLGVAPQLGRLFSDEESKFNGPPVVVLTHALWRRRFGADPNIVGRAITLNDRPATVNGVLPASFDFAAVFVPGTRVDMFSPFPLTRETNRYGNTLAVVGRLKPGISLETGRAEAVVIAKQLERQHPERNDIRPRLRSLAEQISGRFRLALFVLIGAVGVVMLIVCANLSNLQLARMASRRQEMAVRAALGAGRGRLIRQMLTESFVLSAAGAAVGLLVAFAGIRLLAGLDAFSIPLLASVKLDTTALGFTIVLAAATGIVFGLMPALRAPALAVQSSLKDTGRGASDGQRQSAIRGALVVAEVALACVLLVGAGLLLRSFVQLLDVDLGFHPESAAALRIDAGRRYPQQDQRNAYYDEALHRVRSLPGVKAAGLTDILPLGGNRSRAVAGKGQSYPRGQAPEGFVRVVSDGYFAAGGIPLRAGRDFTERDTPLTEPVIVINETMARTLWPGQDPIGQFVQADGINGGGPARLVIGMVGDVRHRALEQTSGCEMYLPIRQSGGGAAELVVRTETPINTLAPSIAAALKPLNPNLAGKEWRPLQGLIDKAMSPRRFISILLAGFSLFALALASLGIYAVITYSVNQRTQEFGIRMAIGASAGELQRQILRQTLTLAGIGIVIGGAASWVLSKSLSGLLFNVSPTDPVTFLGMVLILLTVAVLAGYFPARRASKIDPMIALRAN